MMGGVSKIWHTMSNHEEWYLSLTATPMLLQVVPYLPTFVSVTFVSVSCVGDPRFVTMYNLCHYKEMCHTN